MIFFIQIYIDAKFGRRGLSSQIEHQIEIGLEMDSSQSQNY